MSKMDVRLKMLLFIMISIAAFSAKDLLYGSMVFACVSIVAFSMGQWRFACKTLLAYLITACATQFAGYLPGVLAGGVLMIALCIRMFLPLLLYAGTFISTTSVSEMVAAMYQMKMPKALVIAFTVSLRFFPTAKEEFAAIRDATQLRGIGLGLRNILTRPAVVMEGVLVPIMTRSAVIAEELSAASVSRGIDNPVQRSSYFVLHMSRRDITFTVVISTLLIAILIAKHTPGVGA